jgi:hypothetical protein
MKNALDGIPRNLSNPQHPNLDSSPLRHALTQLLDDPFAPRVPRARSRARFRREPLVTRRLRCTLSAAYGRAEVERGGLCAWGLKTQIYEVERTSDVLVVGFDAEDEVYGPRVLCSFS